MKVAGQGVSIAWIKGQSVGKVMSVKWQLRDTRPANQPVRQEQPTRRGVEWREEKFSKKGEMGRA